MDPASAVVAFVGFSASVVTLCGLVVESSRTLYELQDKVRNAPKELCMILATFHNLEALLIEMQHLSSEVSSMDIPTRQKEAWMSMVGTLESDMVSFRGWLFQHFSLDEDQHALKKQIGMLRRVRVFFAEDRIKTFQQSITHHTAQLSMLHNLISSSQIKDLTGQIQNTSNATLSTTTSLHSLVSDITNQLTQEFESISPQNSQAIQDLRTDFSKLLQMEMREHRNTQQRLSDLQVQPVIVDNRHGIVPDKRRQTASREEVGLSPVNCFGTTVRDGENENRLVLFLPIGTLHYRKNRRKISSTSLVSSGKEREREHSTVSVLFVPATWISSQLFRVSVEFFVGADLRRALSMHISAPGKICSDVKVLESMGYRQSKGKSYWKSGSRINLQDFRNFCDQGCFGPNDLIFVKYFGLITILEGILLAVTEAWPSALQVCEVLLCYGARVDGKNPKSGSLLYMATEEGFLISDGSRSIEKVYFSGICLRDTKRTVLRLLIKHNARFGGGLKYGDKTTLSSDIHGWIPRLMSISDGPEYLLENLFKNWDLVDYEDFDQVDRWLIAILCHTYPTLLNALQSQLFQTNGVEDSSCLLELEIEVVIKQVKKASTLDRYLLISSICRFGTEDMLRLFLKGDFDLDERITERIPGVLNTHLPYICHSTKNDKINLMNCLLDAGVRVREVDHFIPLVTHVLNCATVDIIPVIDSVLASFDFENCKGRSRTLIDLIHRGELSANGIENPSVALNYLLDSLISRGCFLARPPACSDLILAQELIEAVCCRSFNTDSCYVIASYFLSHYKPSLTYAAKSYYHRAGFAEKLTALGHAVRIGLLTLARMLLEAGADIESPVQDGRSALEVAKANLQKIEDDKDFKTYNKKDEYNILFNMILAALRERGLHHIADQALSEVSQYHLRPNVTTKLPSAIVWASSIPKRLCMIIGYFLGHKPSSHEGYRFHRNVAEWVSNFQNLTAITSDGLLIRSGFLITFSLVLGFEAWTRFQDLRKLRTYPLWILKMGAFAVLLVAIALKSRRTEYAALERF